MLVSPAMAVVQPFRAVRYDERRAGPLADLVAPPYDVITPEQRAEYLARSPYNVVHLTLPGSEAEAGRLWREWRGDGVLVDEREPAAWTLSQDYVGPDGVPRTRTGVAVSLRIEPYERGIVLPHERTHRGPKEARLRLLREVRAELEPIFMLHDGPPAAAPEGPPEVEVDGARLWRADTGALAGFEDRRLLIADGHHRYETALAFHEEDGSEESAYLLAVLVSTLDPGLTIFPTHRLAAGAELPSGLDWRDLDSALGELESEPHGTSFAVAYTRAGAALVSGEPGELDTELVQRLAVDGVRYTASQDEARAAVDSGGAEVAFLLRPTRIEDVFAVAERGETMPQKTTYFYPKLLSGILFHPL